MKRLKVLTCLLLLFIVTSSAFAQWGEKPLRIFGYFQTHFEHDRSDQGDRGKINQNSFVLQQLNLFLQKDLTHHWTSFVNFELINNYSSGRNWGAFNLEEAWVKYRKCKELSLKIGLQIPVFNNLNEIKNRTPLLPYIIRPLVYETSFAEFLNLEEFTPNRAFAQAYGFIPYKQAKFDYAMYIGNSPNVNSEDLRIQTGIDTTSTFLIGGRIGLRLKEFKTGLSATYDKINFPTGIEAYSDKPRSFFEEIPRVRLGGDLSGTYWKISLESEFITVAYDDDIDEIEFDKKFYYATLGFHVTEKLFTYASYWVSDEEFVVPVSTPHPKLTTGTIEISLPNWGISYTLSDRITLKAQYATGEIKIESEPLNEEQDVDYYSVAVSTFF